MSRHFDMLAMLADGRFCSGTELGRRLGISRAAVWKAVQRLTALGLDVNAVRGKGYRLAAPMELLDSRAIRAALSAVAAERLREIVVLGDVDSTNRYVMDQAVQGVPKGFVCLAEQQIAGRGRRGRPWVSPIGGNLYLSLLWRYAEGPASLSGLSLAIALAVARTLRGFGADDIAVKWPNDVLWRGRKLAGILLEVSGDSAGPCHVVVGVGLNVRMSSRSADGIDQPWVDMETVLGLPVARNQCAGALLTELLAVLDGYAEHGWRAHLDDWRRFDLFDGQPVVVRGVAGEVTGVGRGVDDQGALLVWCNGEMRRFYSGEVSLRGV